VKVGKTFPMYIGVTEKEKDFIEEIDIKEDGQNDLEISLNIIRDNLVKEKIKGITTNISQLPDYKKRGYVTRFIFTKVS